ncbi:hypothetical protein ROL70_08495 [Cronobacter sakazakii]|uniref:hypothetical protein n=1 Tax=Cronobacter sakazakii TaxID=28141 RepID=UPI0028961F63|nr:hypothetical protein [Cronobacter sakazakii]MDT3585026.1 hypothetical protein [Cronobacter sakazakii]
MKHFYTDLSESRHLSGYISQIVAAIQDESPHLYDDIYGILQQVSPDQMITIGNPAITAPSKFWGCWFGLTLAPQDISELKAIEL